MPSDPTCTHAFQLNGRARSAANWGAGRGLAVETRPATRARVRAQPAQMRRNVLAYDAKGLGVHSLRQDDVHRVLCRDPLRYAEAQARQVNAREHCLAPPEHDRRDREVQLIDEPGL